MSRTSGAAGGAVSEIDALRKIVEAQEQRLNWLDCKLDNLEDGCKWAFWFCVTVAICAIVAVWR